MAKLCSNMFKLVLLWSGLIGHNPVAEIGHPRPECDDGAVADFLRYGIFVAKARNPPWPRQGTGWCPENVAAWAPWLPKSQDAQNVWIFETNVLFEKKHVFLKISKKGSRMQWFLNSAVQNPGYRTWGKFGHLACQKVRMLKMFEFPKWMCCLKKKHVFLKISKKGLRMQWFLNSAVQNPGYRTWGNFWDVGFKAQKFPSPRKPCNLYGGI